LILDNTTYNDISIFHHEEEFSIFHKLNFTQTIGGKEWLRRYFQEPQNDLKTITGIQNIIKTLLVHIDDWPTEISNGTVLVIEKFFDYNIDLIPENPNEINGFFYKWLHGPDYSMIKYSITHFIDFYRGIRKLIQLFEGQKLPAQIQFHLDRFEILMLKIPIKKLSEIEQDETLSIKENLYFGYHLLENYKSDTLELIDLYGRMEAWYSMAVAVKTYNLHFPEFIEQDTPLIQAKALYHILLQKPVAYDLVMNPSQNFLFLTGANMAGKSTLIKSVGSAVFLAHIGMGVPAEKMQLTFFDGLLTNINVADNISKGESYFYNEVQRIKTTIEKINTGKKWLVLIDELFKGTNVQDAMKCSTAVIKGLIKIKNSLFILSTHLYEISEELIPYPNISFRFFETSFENDKLEFSYQLKEGISNDRIGYVILRKEKVVELLDQL
jgi:DNA mismatch repair protein MutS